MIEKARLNSPMKTSNKIIQLLKQHGELTAKELAAELGLTTMGVRQHMLSLEESDEICFEDKKAVRGRPTRFWSLTTKSNIHFSDRHEELTVQLIESVKTVFGDDGLDKLINDREDKSLKKYQLTLKNKKSLLDKLTEIAKIRSEEGYMATIEEIDGYYWLFENHCPICAAATKCLNFCRSELNLFRTLLADTATITREEHIIEGARRCAYKVTAI